jgi:hypothetical protein
MHQNDNLEGLNASDTVDVEVNTDFYSYFVPCIAS